MAECVIERTPELPIGLSHSPHPSAEKCSQFFKVRIKFKCPMKVLEYLQELEKQLRQCS